MLYRKNIIVYPYYNPGDFVMWQYHYDIGIVMAATTTNEKFLLKIFWLIEKRFRTYISNPYIKKLS